MIYLRLYILYRHEARLGEWKVFASNYCLNGTCTDPPVKISIKQYWTRFESDKRAVDDIGIVELSKDVQFTSKLVYICFKIEVAFQMIFFLFLLWIEWIQPICLPNVNAHKNIRNGKHFVSSVWEFKSDSDGKSCEFILRFVKFNKKFVFSYK